MEIRKVEKDGNVLKLQSGEHEGKDFEELYFEVGDEFVPQFRTVVEKVNKDVMVKGQKKNITNYFLKCKVRAFDKDKKEKTIFSYRGEENVFVKLTPTQAKSIMKKNDVEKMNITQHLFVAYKYESKEHGDQIGVGLKSIQKEPKTFEDLDKELKDSSNSTSADNKEPLEVEKVE